MHLIIDQLIFFTSVNSQHPIRFGMTAHQDCIRISESQGWEGRSGWGLLWHVDDLKQSQTRPDKVGVTWEGEGTALKEENPCFFKYFYFTPWGYISLTPIYYQVLMQEKKKSVMYFYLLPQPSSPPPLLSVCLSAEHRTGLGSLCVVVTGLWPRSAFSCALLCVPRWGGG